MKKKVVSIFSGSGGLDLGFLQTGEFEIVLANDINIDACLTYKHNIGDHCICMDIRQLQDIPKVDVLIGGPPCQGFSTANPQRAFDDERNWLFKEYKRILIKSNPKVFVMENVSGMQTLEGGKIYNAIISELSSVGYHVSSKLLNAMDYGAPQNRRRIIIVGVRNDIDADFIFPTPIIIPPLLGKYKTVGDAFSEPIDPNDPNHVVGILSKLNGERIKHITQGGSMSDCPDYLRNNSDLKRAMRRLHLQQPSYTIVHNNCDHYYHPTENRRITIREMARLQGYPDDFIFYGSKSEQSRQVGNSVPIPLAYHIALSVSNFLNKLQEEKKMRRSFNGLEHVLKHTAQRFQLTRPSKVGPVMQLIRECSPMVYEEWEHYYWDRSYTKTKEPVKMNKEVMDELGLRLYEKIQAVVIPEWTNAFDIITLQDCMDYIYEVTLYRTFDGYVREKSVVYDNLVGVFPNIEFSESDSDLDHSGDVDFIGYVVEKNISIGLQIKPITNSFAFGNYRASERMRKNFQDFKEKYGGNVYIIFSEKEKIVNPEVIETIRKDLGI